MIDLADGIVDPDNYGWKAHHLSRLILEGYPVPRAFAIGKHEEFLTVPFEEGTSLAVRSSGAAEDSASESFAGTFASVLKVRGVDAVHKAVDVVRSSGGGTMPMGVIIQEMVVSPIASGVAFSCDPLTFDNSVIHISWVMGLGGALVDGSEAARELRVPRGGQPIAADWPFSNEAFVRLVNFVQSLDQLLAAPADIEWSLNDKGEIEILQLRPIVLGGAAVLGLDSDADFQSLPGIVRSHSKIALRRDASRLGVPMSLARAYVATRTENLPTVVRQPTGHEVSGLSVVLVHPVKIDGKIVRQFSEDCSTDVEFMVRGCQRYAIRQYPGESDAAAAIQRTLETGLAVSAVACVIEQELLYAYATGIARQTDDGYIIEAAIGHFVPKGYVETTVFVLDGLGRLVTSASAFQSKAYHFVNGHVVLESPAYEQLDLHPDDLLSIVATLLPLMRERPETAVEFGLQGRPGALTTYMIDIADSDASGSISAADVGRGVISAGVARGVLTDIRGETVADDLNTHFHDSALSSGLAEPSIYLARRASVDLLRLVRTCHPSSGFIFEQASMLSHLAVVLRERGIAAIVLDAAAIDSFAGARGTASIDTSSTPLVRRTEQ